jgi:hypothetical protein
MDINCSEYFSDKETVKDLREQRDPQPLFKLRPWKNKFKSKEDLNINKGR